jgi:hypothetical protein
VSWPYLKESGGSVGRTYLKEFGGSVDLLPR